MTTHVLIVRDFVPTSINAHDRHWTVRRKLKRADAAIIKFAATQQDVPRALGPRKVTLDVTVSGRRGTCDPDNLLKSTLDALKTCGLILDDKGSLCVLGTPTVHRGDETLTVITLEDLEE